MEQNERIAAIREKFPGYTKPLDSMCKRPEYYGIRRTAEAEALIADKPGSKREANYKLSVRIPLGYVNALYFAFSRFSRIFVAVASSDSPAAS